MEQTERFPPTSALFPTFFEETRWMLHYTLCPFHPISSNIFKKILELFIILELEILDKVRFFQLLEDYYFLLQLFAYKINHTYRRSL